MSERSRWSPSWLAGGQALVETKTSSLRRSQGTTRAVWGDSSRRAPDETRARLERGCGDEGDSKGEGEGEERRGVVGPLPRWRWWLVMAAVVVVVVC